MIIMKKLILMLSVVTGLTIGTSSELRAQDKQKTVVDNGDGTKTITKTKTKKSRKGKYALIGAGANEKRAEFLGPFLLTYHRLP